MVILPKCTLELPEGKDSILGRTAPLKAEAVKEYLQPSINKSGTAVITLPLS